MANKRLQKIHGPSTCVTGSGDIQGDLGNLVDLVDLMDSDDLVDLDDLAVTATNTLGIPRENQSKSGGNATNTSIPTA